MAEIEPVAYIYTDFNDKFGLPRQSGLAPALTGKIIFEPAYRRTEAVRGLEDFSHIWLIWQFSQCVQKSFSPTVRPPRLGGNKRVGVFASRSPFRPNSLGLSCVQLLKIDLECENAPVLYVSGIDTVNGTPVFDIKPYVPLSDLKPSASEGYTEMTKRHILKVRDDKKLLLCLDENKRQALFQALENDPRPGYEDDEKKEYGLDFAGYNIKFKVKDEILYITEIDKVGEKAKK